MGWQQCNIGKKPYLTTYKGWGDPPNIKKYKIVRGNTPKFRSFVVETAFLRKMEGGVLNNYRICSFYGGGNKEKIPNTERQHPEKIYIKKPRGVCVRYAGC